MNQSPEWFRRRRKGLLCWRPILVPAVVIAVMGTGRIDLDAPAASPDPSPKASPAETPAPSAKDTPTRTLMNGPSDAKAASEARTPVYTPGDEEAYPRIRYSDEQVSVNDRCPVRKAKLNLKMDPIYVNGRPVGFC